MECISCGHSITDHVETGDESGGKCNGLPFFLFAPCPCTCPPDPTYFDEVKA